MASVVDKDLQDFCRWYKDHFGRAEDEKDVVVTCLCGHFHTYTKKAKELLGRCESLNLLAIKKNIVFLK